MARTQRYSIAGGIDENTSDSDTKPINFRLLHNCYADRKLGKIVKRDGSGQETITGTLGVPLGCGELSIGNSSAVIPTQRVLLFNFAGSEFRRYKNNTYSSVTAHADTSFTTSKRNTFAQGGETLFIAGGRPAFWQDGGTIQRVGIPAPTTAPTASTGASTGLTGTFQYAYTFYDSVSGRESDLSPIEEVTASDDDIDLSSLETTVAADVDKKRIYRTTAGGTLFYHVATINLATSTYNDTTADAALGAQSPEIGDNGMPPTNSYICAYFNKRMWWVDAAQPNKIVYSKPHIGSDNDLHRYPAENFLITDSPVTGFLVLSNMMLVFHPRSISYIQGFGDDLNIQTYLRGAGTMFSHGAASNGQLTVMLSEEGLVGISREGAVLISGPFDDTLRGILNYSYTDSVYVSVEWSTNLRQFLIMISAVSFGSVPWEVVGSGALEEWIDSDTGDVVEWEDVDSPSGESIARWKLWGFSPDTGFVHEYTLPDIEDLNADSAYGVFLKHPLPSSDTLEITQDKTYFGMFDGTEGKIISLFRRDKTRDGSTNITAKWLTQRIRPGDPNVEQKRIRTVGFPTAATDPTTNGTIQYLRDIDDPEDTSFTANLEDFTDDGDTKIFQRGKCKWFHLYGEDSASPSGAPLLSEFSVRYIERQHRNKR